MDSAEASTSSGSFLLSAFATHSLRNAARLVAALALALLMPGCALRSVSSAPRTYLLNPEISWQKLRPSSARSEAAILTISQPRAQAGFDTDRMAYLLRPYEIDYYAFSQWADTPARMLHRLLVDSLDRSGLWSAVLQSPMAIPAQYRLDCDNVILAQQFFSNPSRIHLALRARLIEIKTQRILASRQLEFFEAADSDDAYGGVQAANKAAAKLITEMVVWLESVMNDRSTY